MPLLSVRRNVSVRRHAVEDEDEDEYGIDYEELEQCLVKFGEAQKQEFSNVNNRLKALSCRTKCSIVIIVFLLLAIATFVGIITFIEIDTKDKIFNSTRPGSARDHRSLDISSGCGKGWIDASFVNMGCLLIETKITTSTWTSGRNFCEEKKATLVEIHNKAQMKFVSGILNSYEEEMGTEKYLWLAGASDAEEEGTWIWAHSGLSVQDFVWGDGNPKNSTSKNYFAFSTSTSPINYGIADDGEDDFPICQKSKL